MNIQKMYAEKLKTATDAVKTVKSGDTVDYGFGATHPVALDKALAARADNLKDITVRGGVALFQPEISKIPAEQNPFIWHDWHMSKATRNLTKAGLAYYIPLRYSEMPRYYRENLDPVNVAMLQVSPMDKHGYFNFGPTASHLGAICDSAKTIIVEINQNFPRCLGGTETGVHISKVDIIVEGDNQALAQLASAPITELDKAVGRFIVEQIPSGACLQLGIGGMPNAVGSLLVDSDVKDLGVHTEMYVDAFVDLSMAGKITGAYKSIDRYRQTFTFGAGTQKLYDFVNDNPEVLAAPVDYVNDIRVISSIDNMISINNVIEVDLFGQINAETSGFRHISGAGGQLDYVLGTYLSKGGKSFICCSSTFKDKTGNLKSRIVPTMAPGGIVTDTRCNVQYLVTEYGIVNLKGKATWQRAEAIISIAHPDFRDELIAKAEQMHIWKATNKR